MLGMPAMIQPVNEKVQEDRPQGYFKRSRGNSDWNLLFEQPLKCLLNVRISIDYCCPLTRRQITCTLGIKSAADTNKWPRIQTCIFSAKSYRTSHSNNVVGNAL